MSVRRIGRVTLLLLMLSTHPAGALDGNINMYLDDELFVLCEAPLLQNTPLKIYVVGIPLGASLSGLQGAEYSIQPSIATDWIFQEDFSASSGAGAVVLGTAMGGVSPGVNIGFSSCQNGSKPVLLQTITVLDVTGHFAGDYNVLTVRGHSSPGNPFFRCPLFNLCDGPAFTKVCVGFNLQTIHCPFPPGALACKTSTGGEFRINPIFPNCPCLCVSVQERTWGEVKRLFD